MPEESANESVKEVVTAGEKLERVSVESLSIKKVLSVTWSFVTVI
jgi:hypothetical protein